MLQHGAEEQGFPWPKCGTTIERYRRYFSNCGRLAQRNPRLQRKCGLLIPGNPISVKAMFLHCDEQTNGPVQHSYVMSQGQTRSADDEHGDSPDRRARVAAPSWRSARPPAHQPMRTRPTTRRTRSGPPSSAVSIHVSAGASTWKAGYEPHAGGAPGVVRRPLGLIRGFRSPASALGLYYCSVTGVARRIHEAESRGNRVSWMSRPSEETLAHRSGVCCDRRTRCCRDARVRPSEQPDRRPATDGGERPRRSTKSRTPCPRTSSRPAS